MNHHINFRIQKILTPEYFPCTNNPMKIIWDEPKRKMNIDKHGLDFAALTVEFFDEAHILDAKENRYLAIGEFEGKIIIAVVFRPLGSEAISVISMRPASINERKQL